MDELISRQVAIDDIWTVSPLAPLDREWIDRWLRQLPPAHGANLAEVGTDCVSRQAAIKILHEALDAADQIADVPFGVYQNYRDKMNELPPAQPSTGDCWGCNCPKMERLAQPEPSQVAKDIARIVENGQDMRVIGHGRIRGRWIPVGGALYKCDQCGVVSLKRKFCSECGADMREVTT